MLKRTLKCSVFLFILTSILIWSIGCTKSDPSIQTQHTFDQFLNEIFVEQVQSDTLSLNYSLSRPENYGIHIETATLGEYSMNYIEKGFSLSENYLKRLHSFSYNSLTADQQLTYDIINNHLIHDLALGDYPYYTECLGPTTGIQAQLPILLAEYGFYDRADIDEYIELLSCTYDYFKDIAQYEREKAKLGFFMSDAVANRIISQCDSFIAYPENNFLITYFNEKISIYEGLTDEEIENYKEANKEAVLTYVIPAYDLLIDTLYELKGHSANDAGLYKLPSGKEYYEALSQYKTGSNKSMKEMAAMLDSEISNGIVEITTISLTDSSLMDKYLSFSSFPITDPDEILSDLKSELVKDFPTPVPVNCQIKYVDDSLSEYLSPAMYLIPPLDDYTDNNIYINGNDEKTLSMIYTTVAHEGYPGHLYQCVYFRNQNPAPIRNVMNFTGYDEGWATYVEYYSYHMAGIDENLADFLAANNRVILCMYARTDIGIHYEGWTKDRAVNYVMKFIDDNDIAETIYNTLLEEPAIYLPYAIGYLEIMELKEKAEDALGDQFVLKDFHEFLLDIGPAPFDVINTYLDKWLKAKK